MIAVIFFKAEHVCKIWNKYMSVPVEAYIETALRVETYTNLNQISSEEQLFEHDSFYGELWCASIGKPAFLPLFFDVKCKVRVPPIFISAVAILSEASRLRLQEKLWGEIELIMKIIGSDPFQISANSDLIYMHNSIFMNCLPFHYKGNT